MIAKRNMNKKTIFILFLLVSWMPLFAEVKTEFPVYLDQKELFKIRTGIFGYSAQVRAHEMSRRLEMFAKEYSLPPDSINVSEGPHGSEIYAGDRFLFAIHDGDASPVGKTRAELAKEYAEIVRKAVIQYRIDYSRKQIVRGSALAVLTTLIVILVIKFLQKLHTRILEKIQAKAVERYGKILEDTHAKRVLDSMIAVLNFIRFILFTIVFLTYLQIVLQLLPWTRPFAGKVMGYVLIPLRSISQGFVAEIPDLFFVAVLIIITWYVLKIIHIFFNLIEFGRITIRGFDAEWSRPTYNIVRILVIAFALVVAF